MTDSDRHQIEQRVLVLMPTLKDAVLAQTALRSDGNVSMLCSSLPGLCRELHTGAGAIVLTEGALLPAESREFLGLLVNQPVWSDVPILVLTQGVSESPAASPVIQQIPNLIQLPGPVQVNALLRGVRLALRARSRQYQLRDYLAERERTELALHTANQAKDQFLAVLSHELRTPLTPVLATASMLERDASLSDDVRESLEVIRRNAELEARLIDDLLDVTRIARGKIQLDCRPVALGTIIRHAVEVCAPDFENRRLHFGVHGACAHLVVSADAARLQQAFWNLLKNAIKYTPPGGRVELRCWQDSHEAVAEVTDTGEGIEPEALEQIFRPFEQGERTLTRKYGGLGLGLAITKALVEMHGGTISAASPGRGKGATFTMRLPALAPATPQLRPELHAMANHAEAPAARSLRILLVEDHGDTARIIARLLQSAGHEVRTAGDVATALSEAEQNEFDVVVSDLGLPDRSGLDLMEVLRARGKTWPAIAMTGYGQEEDVQRTKEVGFAMHLTKPIDFQQLEMAIARVTSG